MKNRVWNYSILAISLAGIGVSSYLEYLSTQPTCPIGFQGCEIVLLSPYSKVFGISLAILGLLWFTILLTLSIYSFFSQSRKTSLILLSWSLLSIPSVITLVFIEIVIIESICTYCTVSHILGISSIIPAYNIAKAAKSTKFSP